MKVKFKKEDTHKKIKEKVSPLPHFWKFADSDFLESVHFKYIVSTE